MLIVGGVYEERCHSPEWNQIFGSGGRAACVVRQLFNANVTLISQYSHSSFPSLQASFAPYEIDLQIAQNAAHIMFDYAHPLSRTRKYTIGKGISWSRLKVSEDKLLLFGMVEGIPQVNARAIVLDPQGYDVDYLLGSGYISAASVSVVANKRELVGQRSGGLRSNIDRLFRRHPQVHQVVAKLGAHGAVVFERRKRRASRVPVYQASTVFKIGSGDVFSAVFGYLVLHRKVAAAEAADTASRAVSCYVQAPHLNFTMKQVRAAIPVRASQASRPMVYMAAPFFTLADKLLLQEARMAVASLDIGYFSPFHHVGLGHESDASKIAMADLRGLQRATSVLALLPNADCGTLFEVGYARSKNIPVVAFCERPIQGDLTMLQGTKCEIQTDFCTAVYRSVWKAIR